MIVLLLGPPGCGKGTQGERIAAALSIPKLSTGDILRDAARAGTPLGIQASQAMGRGDLVPDDVILGILKDALCPPACPSGVVLDGVVRTVAQAEGLSRQLTGAGRILDLVLYFDVEDEEVVRRLGSRTVCGSCQSPATERRPGEVHDDCPQRPKGTFMRRKDDEPDTVRNRLRVYREQTEPVLGWYERSDARFVRVAGGGSLQEVGAHVMAAVRAETLPRS